MVCSPNSGNGSLSSVELSLSCVHGQVGICNGCLELDGALPLTDAYKDNVWFIPVADVTINKNQPLGKGGFGEVYTGYYGTIPVAIKTITGLDDPKAVKMAKSEATLWHTLRHPNITPLYGVSVDEQGNPMLIIERAETSLISRLYCWKGEEPVSREIKLRWILQIAQAFKYLHAQKNPVIHADLNPRNVLIGYDGFAKITDFGISRCLLASHTFSRQAHGPIRYSPPESFGRKYQATTAYDVYSFAMIVYEILSQVQPFDDAQFPEMISTWVKDGERPESQPDHIPEDSWEWSLIQACWDQDPTKRPSFEEIVKTILEHADLPNIGPRSFSLSESIAALSVSPNVPARASPLSKDKTETTLVETSIPAAGGEDTRPSFSDTILVESPGGQAASADILSKQLKVQPAGSKSPKLAGYQGDANEQNSLGDRYYHGQGVVQNYTKAVEWYTLAANQGDAEGQCNLGFMYNNGKGVAQDYSKALEWYTLASNQAHAKAQLNLGLMYENGRGVAVSYKKAVELYTLAANQGFAIAQAQLGFMYANGRGVAQDNSKAVEWFTLAANQGDAEGQCNLGFMYNNGKGVAQDYSKALEWYTLASNQAHARARYNLGLMYENGQGVALNYRKAFQLYTLAANQEFPIAQAELGVMYENGRGVAQDSSKAVEWFTLAANQGDARAQYNLGLMYEHGEGVALNFRKAVELYTFAANQGFAIAQTRLGVMYEKGLGVTKNAGVAKMWKDKAAQTRM